MSWFDFSKFMPATLKASNSGTASVVLGDFISIKASPGFAVLKIGDLTLHAGPDGAFVDFGAPTVSFEDAMRLVAETAPPNGEVIFNWAGNTYAFHQDGGAAPVVTLVGMANMPPMVGSDASAPV